ncbi:hypothetical protein EW145_g2860 [Phellinidium pouzarii]|uniref:NADP-dependent oxidoreductase domain-containing protein n=1 Tax=Phellinidium pouzarii TaxID=167371 RepID=A0A4S4LES6_9AGAM|nr:hypothetical protein EW145_g2860 [Phellinidium pouzarii]
MAVEQRSPLNIVMVNFSSALSFELFSHVLYGKGAMTFGEAGKAGARVHNLKDVEAILDVFQAHGHYEIDTSRTYSEGTSEEYLGKIGWQSRGLKMDTKLYPDTVYPGLQKPRADIVTHKPEIQLKALNTDKLEMWYLHGPDRTTPYEVTMKAVNDLYNEGQVNPSRIPTIEADDSCRFPVTSNDLGSATSLRVNIVWINRNVESELFPCMRKFGISFYEFNPLGGGFFTGRYSKSTDYVEEGTRFDPTKFQGQGYRKRYWNEPHFKALEIIRNASEKAGLTMAEVALRWVTHHSLMKREFGDSILIGASSLNHIEQNLVDLEKGPLPDEVVKALDEAWLVVKPYSANYFH